MKQIEKDEILKQVGSVLQFCHGIVSRLLRLECSSSSPSPPIQSSTIANYELNTTMKMCPGTLLCICFQSCPQSEDQK